MFSDRTEAGRRLAENMADESLEDGLILGIPRGGVIVAAKVAEKLGLPLDIIIPRKIGVPFNTEVAIGAVTQDGTVILDDRLMTLTGLDEADLRPQIEQEIAEIARRTRLYRGDRPEPEYRDRTVVLVDDGIATGSTTLAALRSIRKGNPRTVILAVPVAPPETLDRLAPEVDRIICLEAPDPFYAVGQFYDHFDQTSDEEVIDILNRNKAWAVCGCIER
ncbi:MAG: phosphoribosyltransferase [Candidatus Desulforudaceae bacterium]|jgi:predicted phosphoribosyltransferase|nr:phosphoribosyltransferase [Bacillota bacterium]MBV1727572.1 phosphoribosyltransferase [Desulforudis sp.]MDQ7789681.1 phosphoribosyltransferase [Clostridia bacterium]MBU4534124.1 phosphoribosyltransferase [Bacillota bacterium]MBU4553370.1 phosphoribosyltransferase [Bacillota bacterium]